MVDGQKLDQGKPRFELFPGDALFGIVWVLTFGATKYDDRNWENGIKWGRVFSALMRHMWAWWQGKGPTNKSFLFGSLDDETKVSHLWHAGCCIVFLIAYEMRGMTSFDDRPKGTAPISNPVGGEKVDNYIRDYQAGKVREQMDPTYHGLIKPKGVNNV